MDEEMRFDVSTVSVSDDSATLSVSADVSAGSSPFEHEYSTEKFVTDKTLAEVYALDAKVDYSTTVFVVTA